MFGRFEVNLLFSVIKWMAYKLLLSKRVEFHFHNGGNVEDIF